MLKPVAAGALALLALSSCDALHRAKEAMGALFDVQQTLAKNLPGQEVAVNVSTGGYMNVSLINSSWKDLPEAEQKEKARQTAKLAFDGYRNRADLTRISVTFVVHKSFVVVNYTNTMNSYAFSPSDLK